uniref:Acetyltransferase domain-containing protein,putative n=1 Tax=Neospora caninum (strain Liverpool) TaxID=572307 RepID=A0A0F7UAN2_NEOCL|nr:TPA: acetyltransferase domain-containing protein,putative [Neospora caninum Liverpool]
MDRPADRSHFPAEATVFLSSSFQHSRSSPSSPGPPSSGCPEPSSLRFCRFPRLLPLSVFDSASQRLNELSAFQPSVHDHSSPRVSASSSSSPSCSTSSPASSAAWQTRELWYWKASEDLRELEDRQASLMRERDKEETDVHALLKRTLSEPYSVYTLRYFLEGWPELTILAYDGQICAGACMCKIDEKERISSVSLSPIDSCVPADTPDTEAFDDDFSLPPVAKARGGGSPDAESSQLPGSARKAGVHWTAFAKRQESVRKGYIAMLSVHPNYRRRGLATTLVQTVLEEMQKRHPAETASDETQPTPRAASNALDPRASPRNWQAPQTSEAEPAETEAKKKAGKMVNCRIETEVPNAGALRLYESLSFVRVARMPRFYLNDNDAFKLSRSFEDEQPCLAMWKEEEAAASREKRLHNILKESTCWW